MISKDYLSLYGIGYISWAIEQDGGYTAANAVAFSDMKKQENGWAMYGNPDYVNAVMKYYLSDTPVPSSGQYLFPLIYEMNITSPFGYRIHPISGEKETMHNGVDFGAPNGTEIMAVEQSVVVYSDVCSGYGLHIKIQHNDGHVTTYSHCSELLVSKNDVVEQGKVIAKVGSTGNSTGNHLHFEIIRNGEYIDPMTMIQHPNSNQ